MRTIIAGSRDITSMKIVEQAIEQSGFEITEVVCGEATGPDSLGKVWAERNGIPVVSFPAKWKDLKVPGAVIRRNKYGEYNARAGYDRNEQMAAYAEALIAVWDGVSGGTRDMIDRAKAHGLKVYIYNV